MSIWKFKNIPFNTKLEHDMFMKGYEYCLKEMQKNRIDRGKENEIMIPFKSVL